MKLRPTLILLLYLSFPVGAAQVTISASALTATIAERIDLRVVVRTQTDISGIKITVPEGDYDIIGRSALPAANAGDTRTFEETITIAFFKTGDFTVGPLVIEMLNGNQVKEKDTTGQLTVKIRSLLTENDKDIKPLKSPLPLSGNPMHLLKYVAAGGMLALFLISLFIFIKKRKTQEPPFAVAPLLPEIELEMRIRELREKKLPEQGEFRQFFIALSEIIKHFIQRVYEFHAVDFTTAETLTHLQSGEKDPEIVMQMETIFQQADLVKFAKQIPEIATIGGLYKKIATLIGKYKQRHSTTMTETHVQTGL